MNFPNMPNLQAPYVVAIVAGMVVLICVGPYVRFKKRRWL